MNEYEKKVALAKKNPENLECLNIEYYGIWEIFLSVCKFEIP